MNIVGLDEVGRGALAGLVVTGGVCFTEEIQSKIITKPRNGYIEFRVHGDEVCIADSKKLTPGQRRVASDWICEHAQAVGIGKSSVKKIDELGIVPATNQAFRKSVKEIQRALLSPIDLVLVDAFFIPRLPGIVKDKQKALVRGDATEFCIAAASIIAKVYRDREMERLSQKKEYEVYLWGRNKGYGTSEHCAAIRKYGTTEQHRKLFVRKVLGEHK